MSKEMIYFQPGEVVEVKQNIENKPRMVVKSASKARMPRNGTETKNVLLGIKCFWFTADGVYLEHTFNSKDLQHA